MIPVKLNDPTAIGNQIWNRSDDHPERQYYVFRYRYELSVLLSTVQSRIVVASISEGSVIVNTILTAGSQATGRSAHELMAMLKALSTDGLSAMHWEFKSSGKIRHDFFKWLVRDFSLKDITVTLCQDNTYRSLCPYTDALISAGTGWVIFIASVCGITLILALCAIGSWRCDLDSERDGKNREKEFLARASYGDPGALDPGLRTEYARSWLEGRYMGDDL